MIELGKTYKTRDGRDVRIYAVDGGVASNCVHGAIRDKDGFWYAYQWYPHGGYLSGIGDPRDLIEVKPRIKRKVWVNVYQGELPEVAHPSKREADCFSNETRIACVGIDIDVEEGHGL